jgi:serine/threonine-protein kinase RsbT
MGSHPLRDSSDVVTCRRLVSQLADILTFSTIGRTLLVTAASEIARNTVVHGGGGELRWQVVGDSLHRGIKLEFLDNGPGISNMTLAMTDGWSSGGGLGLGLPGARRLVHEFAIESSPSAGTRVTIIRWK